MKLQPLVQEANWRCIHTQAQHAQWREAVCITPLQGLACKQAFLHRSPELSQEGELSSYGYLESGKKKLGKKVDAPQSALQLLWPRLEVAWCCT